MLAVFRQDGPTVRLAVVPVFAFQRTHFCRLFVEYGVVGARVFVERIKQRLVIRRSFLWFHAAPSCKADDTPSRLNHLAQFIATVENPFDVDVFPLTIRIATIVALFPQVMKIQFQLGILDEQVFVTGVFAKKRCRPLLVVGLPELLPQAILIVNSVETMPWDLIVNRPTYLVVDAAHFGRGFAVNDKSQHLLLLLRSVGSRINQCQ